MGLTPEEELAEWNVIVEKMNTTKEYNIEAEEMAH